MILHTTTFPVFTIKDDHSENEYELLLHESTTPLVIDREAAFPSSPVPLPSTATQQ